jgi:uncharacterized protein YodC (DUF2158 family)
MAEESVGAGDVVYLKSGGPPMTIQSIGFHPTLAQEMATCQWFEGTKHKSEFFAPHSLTKTKPDSIGGYPS